MANPLKLPMLGRSLRNVASRPATRRYPVEIRPPFPGARGTLEFDLETCVFCNLCARKCPAVAITCNRDEKYFAIDQLSCIACGVCVDVCNKNSLRLSTEPRHVHTVAEVGSDGTRPGLQEWHKVEAEPTVIPDAGRSNGPDGPKGTAQSKTPEASGAAA
jgi:ech hydrogenase subunit F